MQDRLYEIVDTSKDGAFNSGLFTTNDILSLLDDGFDTDKIKDNEELLNIVRSLGYEVYDVKKSYKNYFENNIKIPIDDEKNLIIYEMDKPYDKEIDIFVEELDDNKEYMCKREILRISPSYEIDDNSNVNYNNERIDVKLWLDNEDDFSEDFGIYLD